MIGKLKRRSSRIGLLSVKAAINIDIVELILPDEEVVHDGSVLSVCFERGGKISCTSNRTYDRVALLDNNNPLQTKVVLKTVVFPIYENVTLIATLYKDLKAGVYQEKTGKIILRQLKKNKVLKNSESYKGLAYFDLKLDDLVNELEALNKQNNTTSTTLSKETTLNLELLKGAQLKVIITTSLLTDNDDNEGEHNFGDNELDIQPPSMFMVDDHNLTGENDSGILGATFDDSSPLSGSGNYNAVNSKRRKSRMSFMMESTRNLSINNNLNELGANDALTPPHKESTFKHNENLKVVSHSLSGLFNSSFDEETIAATSTPTATINNNNDNNNTINNNTINNNTTQNEENRVDRHSTESSDPEFSDRDLSGDDNMRSSILNRDDIVLYQNTLSNSKISGNRDTSTDSATPIQLDFHSVHHPEHLHGLIDIHSPSSDNNAGLTTPHKTSVSSPTATATTTAATDANTTAVDNATTPAEQQPATEHKKKHSSKKSKEKGGNAQDEEGFSSSGEETESLGDDDSIQDTTVNGHTIKKSKLRLKKVKANKEAFLLYNKELAIKAARISRLEDDLANQAKEYQDKFLVLHTQLQISESENRTLKDIINTTAAMHAEANERAAAEHLSALEIANAATASAMELASRQAIDSATTSAIDSAIATGDAVAEGSEDAPSTKVSNGRAYSQDFVDITQQSQQQFRQRESSVVNGGGEIIEDYHETLSARPSTVRALSNATANDRMSVAYDRMSVVGSLGAEEYLRRASFIHSSVDGGVNHELITVSDYAKAVAELHTIKQEVIYLKNALQNAINDKNEETQAAKEAATEAVRANMRRADLQQENEELLEDLIEIKMKYANQALDLDQETMLSMALNSRLQRYAEQLTNLEVKYTVRHSLSAFDSPHYKGNPLLNKANNKADPHLATPARNSSTSSGGSNVVYTNKDGKITTTTITSDGETLQTHYPGLHKEIKL